MNNYLIFTDTPKGLVTVEADDYKMLREKGGFCRYEFYKEGKAVATFKFDIVLFIKEL